jgi:excisionase family DNA binding protein
MATMSHLLTTREVADILGLSSEAVLRRWRAGQIPGFRLGSNVLRFDEAEIPITQTDSAQSEFLGRGSRSFALRIG